MRLTDESSRRLLNILHTNAVRGGEMIKQALSFARGVEGEHIALQPAHLISESRNTDMMMPYMDGLATIGALRRLDPRAPIIATGGLKGEGKMADAAQLGVKTFLPKGLFSSQMEAW